MYMFCWVQLIKAGAHCKICAHFLIMGQTSYFWLARQFVWFTVLTDQPLYPHIPTAALRNRVLSWWWSSFFVVLITLYNMEGYFLTKWTGRTRIFFNMMPLIMHQGHQFVDHNLKHMGKLNYKKKINRQTKLWLHVVGKPMGKNFEKPWKYEKHHTSICCELLATPCMHIGIDTVNCMRNYKFLSCFPSSDCTGYCAWLCCFS